jgi:hypothetical protein
MSLTFVLFVEEKIDLRDVVDFGKSWQILKPYYVNLLDFKRRSEIFYLNCSLTNIHTNDINATNYVLFSSVQQTEYCERFLQHTFPSVLTVITTVNKLY